MEKLEKIAEALSQDAANASKTKAYLERIAQESDVEELDWVKSIHLFPTFQFQRMKECCNWMDGTLKHW